MQGLQRAWVDGKVISVEQAYGRLVADGAGLRSNAHLGDGVFETIGVWGGHPFRVSDHLRRLCESLEAIGLPEPDVDEIAVGIAALLEGVGEVDAALRVYATASGTRVVTLTDLPVRPVTRHLVPYLAPWIRPVHSYGPAGAKTMSYAHNMAATRAARAAGGDDALLVANEGWILEGPTFAVLWVVDGVLRTPAVDLGIVDSITRRTLIELADLPVEEGGWTLDDLAGASGVMVSSSLRDVEAVRRVGHLRIEGETRVRDRLAAALWAARRGRAGIPDRTIVT